MAEETGAKPEDKPGAKPDDEKDLGEAGKRAIAKEREARKAAEKKLKDAQAEASANAEAAKKLKELEDADKSEQQRLADQVAEATKRADAAEAKALRLEVAAEKGLPGKFAGRLQGSTREEIESDADDLLESIKPASEGGGSTNGGGGKPKEKLRSGAAPEGEGGSEEVTKEDLLKEMPRL